MSEDKLERHTARPLRLIGRFLRRSWQGLLVAVLAIALGIAAYLSPGLVEADVRLDEGNLYAINRGDELLGTVNSQIKQLSNAAPIGDQRSEVLQSGDTVLLLLPQSSSLVAFDAARNITASPTKLPPNAGVQLVGETLLVYRPESGAIWSGDLKKMLALDFDKEKPEFEIGEGGIATLTADGDVIGLDPGRSALVRHDGDQETLTQLPFELETDSVLELSAVGNKAVVLDRTSSRIWVEGMDQAFPVSEAASAELMEPAPSALGGEDGARAIFANSAGLNRVTTDGLESVSGRIDHAPVAPVQVGDCVYGAGVSGTEGTFVKKCRGQDPIRVPIESITSDGSAIDFQVNRGVVALNDLSNGTLWMVDKDMFIIHPEDWRNIVPEDKKEDDNQESTETNVVPERSEENRPPVANDDPNLSARAGTSTILHVLDNDTDPDGDVLTIIASEDQTGMSLQPINNGAGLQISLEGAATGTYEIKYTIDDGRKGTDTAVATVKVLPADRSVNKAPTPVDRPGGIKPLQVKLNSEVSKRVLLDWRDPDGDPLMLKDASVAGDVGDMVSFTPDGTITFIDVGKKTGPKTINVVVSDGVSDTKGEVELVVKEDPVAPVAYGDFVTTGVSTPVRVEPLANDQISSTATLTEVPAIEGCAECRLETNYREQNFTFSASKAGVYYLPYTIVDGEVATSVVRIDVRAESTDGRPVAAQDVALLPEDGTVTLDPLLNDTDPNGDVLVVQTYEAPDSLEVVMERRHVMAISARRPLDGPVQFPYTISDGSSIVTGWIVVVPTSGGSQLPNALNDSIRVRAGTTATVTPLENDSSPTGMKLSLESLGDNPFKDRAWIDGDRVRVTVPAGSPAGVTSIPYRVSDAKQNQAPARINVEVIPEDANNVAPQPEPVIDRVLAGTETRIAVPLSGLDANGDAVRLAGIASGPQLGRITSVGDEYLTYEAFAGKSGTDTFTYEVVDAHGATGIGEARIGVVPVNPKNVKPVAVQDRISVRPGRPVRISALENDFDADGDNFGYTNGAAIEMDGGIKAEVQEREIVLTAPEEEGLYTGSYSIQDVRGEQAYGQFIVEVDPKAKLIAPIARDDSVGAAAIADEKFVKVGVLDNDYDPDGAKDDLRVEVPDVKDPDEDPENSVRVDEDGKSLLIPVKDAMQQIRYTVVDADDNRTNGLVTVPGRRDVAPYLKDPNKELKPTAGQPFTIDVNQLVVGVDGRDVAVTNAERIWGTWGTARPEGPGRVEYVGDVRHQGPASVAFEVRDNVPGDNKEAGKTSVITVPLDVQPAPVSEGGSDQGPTDSAGKPPVPVVSDPRLQVGAGEGPRTLDLLSLFRDPDGAGGSMTLVGDLREVSGDADVRITRDAQLLRAEAPETAKVGTNKVLAGTIVDADGIELDFTVTVEVTRSTRPLVSTADDTLDDQIAGSTVTLPVTGNDKSNLLGDPKVNLVEATATGPGGTVTNVDKQSGVVTVKLAEGFSGMFTARYTVNDATGDPDRQTTGQIRINVIAKPGQPSTPYGGVPGDGTITVQYRQLNGNGGSEIISAVAVASSPGRGDVSGTCSAQTCQIAGLANGVPWTVKVKETNQVGDSDFSPASAPLTPDTNPSVPGQPSVQFGNGKLTLSWTHQPIYTSPNGGSPLTGYEIRISGGTTGSKTVPPNVREFTWPGLTNGTNYMFEVEATNSTGKKSGFSPASVPEKPSAPPSGNSAPVATVIEDEIGGGFTVSFNTANVNNGGADITEYMVVPVFDGARQTSKQVALKASSTTAYSTPVYGMGRKATHFVITATNRSGTSDVGVTSPPKIAYPKAKVTGVTATAGEESISISKIESNVAAGDPVKYLYSLNGGDWRHLGGPTGTISGLTNGEDYTLRVRVELAGTSSNTWTVGNDLRPKTKAPPPPTVDRYELVLPDKVRAYMKDSLTETGGWGIDAYTFCTSTSAGGCPSSRFNSTLPRVLEAGETNFIYWKVSGSDPVKYERPIDGVAEPELDGGKVTFSFPYALSGQCVLTAVNAEDGTATQTVSASSGKLSGTVDFTAIPIPTPPTTGPTTSPAVSGTAKCRVNGGSTYEYDF